MAFKIVTFGEIMLRLTPPGYERLMQARNLEMIYGGAEANVAVSLARFGIESRYVTKLPKNPLGDGALDELRRYGVDTSFIVRGGDRLGVYYMERGASLRGSDVIYDRAGSAIANAVSSDFNWDEIFAGAGWFHFTGITPALGGELFDITMEACKVAKARGITISCDINFRTKLWDAKTAGESLGKLLEYVDVCIVNEEHAGELFGIYAPGKEKDRDAFNRDMALYVSEELKERFDLQKVAITYRRTISANENIWWATLYDGGDVYISPKYRIEIIDRVGSGDAFAAGLIYGLIDSEKPQFAVEFGAACCALKHTIEGDFNHVYVDEVKKLMDGNGGGRVSR